MQFFKTIGSSVYGPAFYKADLPPKRLSFSVRYLIGLVLVVSLLVVIPFIGLFTAALKIARESAASYPAALVFTIKSGVVSTNTTEPYVVAYKAAPAVGSDAHKNFLVIDTSVPEGITAFNNFDTTIWIGKDFIISEGTGGKISVDQIPTTMNLTLSKQGIDDFSAKFHPYLPLLAVLSTLLFYVVIALGSFVGMLLSALIVALVIYLVERIQKSGQTFHDSYKYAIHSLTLPILLSVLFPGFSAYFILVALAAYYVNMNTVPAPAK